ncbi:MAG TPA: ABC transporter ATP-binding protein, partial [Spirochaetia bacterium]
MMFGATMRMIGFDRRPRLGRTATLSALEGVVAAMIQGSLLVVVYQTVSGSFDARSLAVMLAGIALGLALRWYLGSRAMLSCQITGAEFIKEARMAIGERLRRVPLGFFQKHRAGDLTSRLMANLQDVETILTHLYPEIVTSLVTSVLVAVCLFVVDWRLALVALAFLPLAIPLVVFTNRLFAGAGRRRYTVNGEMNDAFVEFLAGIRTLKAHDMALEKLEHLKGLIDESKRVSLKVEFLGALILGPFQAFLDLGLALVLLVGITFLTGGSLSTADFVAVALLSFFLYKPIKVLSQEQAELRNAEEAARTIAAIVDEPGQSWGEEGFRPRDVSLVFENVSFSYDGRSEALRDVSFAVPAGRVVALVGPSGSGKTTAANLAMRLWDPDRGRIIFSGRDIATIRPEELLANVGVV